MPGCRSYSVNTHQIRDQILSYHIILCSFWVCFPDKMFAPWGIVFVSWPAQNLVHSRFSINAWWINERMNEPEEMVRGLKRQTMRKMAKNFLCKWGHSEQSLDAKFIPMTLCYVFKTFGSTGWQGARCPTEEAACGGRQGQACRKPSEGVLSGMLHVQPPLTFSFLKKQLYWDIIIRHKNSSIYNVQFSIS